MLELCMILTIWGLLYAPISFRISLDLNFTSIITSFCIPFRCSRFICVLNKLNRKVGGLSPCSSLVIAVVTTYIHVKDSLLTSWIGADYLPEGLRKSKRHNKRSMIFLPVSQFLLHLHIKRLEWFPHKMLRGKLRVLSPFWWPGASLTQNAQTQVNFQYSKQKMEMSGHFGFERRDRFVEASFWTSRWGLAWRNWMGRWWLPCSTTELGRRLLCSLNLSWLKDLRWSFFDTKGKHEAARCWWEIFYPKWNRFLSFENLENKI